MTRVLIIEDHRIVALGLELGLRSEGFEVRSTDGYPADLAGVLAGFPPEVVLLDIHLAQGRSGIGLIPALRAPGRAVLVLTAETDPTILARALEAGADAVFYKTMAFSQVIREIRAISGGQSSEADQRRLQVLSDARAAAREKALRLAPFAQLTPREEQVLAMLVDGVQAADIAEGCYVSLATVRSQIRGILTKLGVGSQLAAVAAAVKAAWGPAGAPRSPGSPAAPGA